MGREIGTERCDISEQDVKIVVFAEQVLRLLEPSDESSRSPIVTGDGFDQVAQPLEGDAGAMHLLDVRGVPDPAELLLNPGNLKADQCTGCLTEGRRVVSPAVGEFDAEGAERSTELLASVGKATRHISQVAGVRLLLPLFQSSQKPVISRSVLRGQKGGTMSQPVKLDLGVAARVGCPRQPANSAPHLARNAVLQRLAICAQGAAKPSKPNPEVVERVGILTITQALLRERNLVEIAQGQYAGGFPRRSGQQVRWKS